MLHLPAALLRFSSVYAIASWSYERLHQISKRVFTNNTSIEMSILRRSLLVVKTGIARAQNAEAAAGQTVTGAELLHQEYEAQRYHGAVHPGLYDNVKIWQRRIDVGLLPACVAKEWPLTLGRTRAKISDDDLADIKAYLTTRSNETDFDARAYLSDEAKTSTTLLVRDGRIIFVLRY